MLAKSKGEASEPTQPFWFLAWYSTPSMEGMQYQVVVSILMAFGIVVVA